MLEIVYESALVLDKLRRNVPMPRADVTIKTRDGNCPASLFTPALGKGPWPGVIFYIDGLGVRPVMWEMGQRLADGGYLVLQPDRFRCNSRNEDKGTSTLGAAQAASTASQTVGVLV